MNGSDVFCSDAVNNNSNNNNSNYNGNFTAILVIF